jgi:tetratricopeptide (TPR) repeat protein
MARIPLLAAALLLLAGSALPAPAAAATAGELNEAGVVLFERARTESQAGRSGEAAASDAAAEERFREALAADPGFAPAARNLGATLAALAQADLAAGRYDDARRRLEEAAGLLPDEPQLPYLLAVVASRRGDLAEARRQVEEALARAPDSVPALALSGDLHYQDGSLNRALRAWDDALERATGAERHALEVKIERARKEDRADGDFKRDVSRHFTLQSDGPVSRDLARAALVKLESAYDLLWGEFNARPGGDIPVILYGNATFRDLNPLAPVWASGTYDGKIRIPVGGLSTERDAERLGPILTHELTHAFLRAYVPAGRLPLWFEEGLAEHYEGQSAERARATIAAHRTTFASLDEVSRALLGGDRVAAAYAAALLAAEELFDRGARRPVEVLEAMRSGQPFADAFREAARADLAEFEDRWRRQLP